MENSKINLLDKVLGLLLDEYNNTFTAEFQAKLSFLDRSIAFEFQALTWLMDCLVKRATAERDRLDPKINETLQKLNNSHAISVRKELEDLRAHKTAASRLESSLERVTGALNDVLEDDNELIYMQLNRFVEEPTTFWRFAEVGCWGFEFEFYLIPRNCYRLRTVHCVRKRRHLSSFICKTLMR